MSGEIKHEWDGSVLTVYSDSGASSADLKGPKGDVGPRGPQGAPGVIYDADGELVLDLSPYATMDDVAAAIDNIPEVDMAPYATKNFVSTSIAMAQLEGAGVDTSGFATKDDIANIEVEVDHQTIITDQYGNLRTAIGGFANQGGGVNYKVSNIEYVPRGPWNSWQITSIGNIGKAWVPGCMYNISITFKDGVTIAFDAMFQERYNDNGVFEHLTMISEAFSAQSRIGSFQAYTSKDLSYSFNDGDFNYGIISLPSGYKDGDPCPASFIATAVTITAEDYVPIDGHYIPVDGTSIYLNNEGKLASAGGGGSANLENYYTKDEVDSLVSNVDLTNYYTKSQVDAKITYGLSDLTAGSSALATGSLYMVYE